jgi:hypothetical protein
VPHVDDSDVFVDVVPSAFVSEHIDTPVIVCFTPLEPSSDVIDHVPGDPAGPRVNLYVEFDNVPDAFFHAFSHSSWQSFNACADVDVISIIIEKNLNNRFIIYHPFSEFRVQSFLSFPRRRE